MSHKKTLLYILASLAWVFILMCTFLQDHSNTNSWGEYAGESKEISLENGASVQYGLLSTGDTQVTLQYGKQEVSAIVPNQQVVYRALFPVGNQHVAVSFSEPENLDTLVLFGASDAYVFQHVVAVDSDSGRIASLQANYAGGVDLVVSTLEQTEVSRVSLDGHDKSFLNNPQIQSASFSKNHFRLNTLLGVFVAHTLLQVNS